jgi:serine/threonine-protein kinase
MVKLKQLVGLLYDLYSVNSLVLIAAVYLALIPDRPEWMLQLDNALYEVVATPEQTSLLDNERALQKSRAYDEMGLNDLAGSLASIFNGDAFRFIDTRDELSPAAFPLVERLALVLMVLIMMRGLRKVPEERSLKWVVAVVATALLIEVALLRFANIWLPLGLPSQFLLGAYFIMLLQLKHELHTLSIKDQLHQTSLEFASTVSGLDTDQKVLSLLKQCKPCPETYELAYRYAQAQESK